MDHVPWNVIGLSLHLLIQVPSRINPEFTVFIAQRGGDHGYREIYSFKAP